eukprot:XP_019923775.1 PREDICTED: uncharacterized protein LOC109619029 [Crassostrea gigas]
MADTWRIISTSFSQTNAVSATSVFSLYRSQSSVIDAKSGNTVHVTQELQDNFIRNIKGKRKTLTGHVQSEQKLLCKPHHQPHHQPHHLPQHQPHHQPYLLPHHQLYGSL